MKIFDLLAKSQLASIGRIQKSISGQNDIAEHLQANAECKFADMMTGSGETEALDSLHASNLGGPLHEMFVIAKTPDSFLSDRGECQKMSFRWTTSNIAEITSSQIHENSNMRKMLGGSAARKMEANRMYARTVYDAVDDGYLLDFYFDDDSLDRLDARLNEALFGESGGYVLRGHYEYEDEKYIVLLQGCHGGKQSTLFLASEWNAPLQQNFTYYSSLTDGDDFTTMPLIYPDNRDANCKKDNEDPFCSPCKEKENCYELFDCTDGQYINYNETYANVGTITNDFLLSFEVKIPSSGVVDTFGLFSITTDNDGDINFDSSTFDDINHHIINLVLGDVTGHDEDYWMSFTVATHTVAGQRTLLYFIDDPTNNNYPLIEDYETLLSNSVDGYHDQPGFVIVGGHPMNDTANPHEIRNAYFQKGSLQNIFN